MYRCALCQLSGTAVVADRMEPYDILILLEEAPKLWGLVICLLCVLSYAVLGFWVVLTIILAVLGASLPSVLLRRYAQACELRRNALRKALEARLLRGMEQGRAEQIRRCPDCARADCKRHQPSTASDYVGMFELWMTVTMGRSLNDAVGTFLDRLIDEFVRTWYDPLSDDAGFLTELRLCARHGLAQIATRMRRVDVPRFLVTRVIPLLIRHLELYNLQSSHGTDGRSTAGSTYLCRFFYELLGNNSQPSLRARDAMQKAAQYRRRILNSPLHIALFSRYTELNYVRRLLDDVLCRTDLLPMHAKTSEPTLIILREVLAVAVLVPALDALAEPQFVNTCLYKLFEPSAELPSCTPQPNERFLQRFVPVAAVQSARRPALREAHFVSIEQLSNSQTQLFEFMQFLKRVGAVRFLQLYRDLDELNRELFSAEIDNASRLRDFRSALSNVLARLQEQDVYAAMESTVHLLADLDSSSDAASEHKVNLGKPTLQRYTSYTSEMHDSCMLDTARTRSSSQPLSLSSSLSHGDTNSLDSEPCNMLASQCCYEQLLSELQKVLDGPQPAIFSLLKSFCTLRLFSLLQAFLEMSCLREFNADEVQYLQRFGSPLELTVNFDIADCYSSQLVAREDVGHKKKKRAGLGHRTTAQKALQKQTSVTANSSLHPSFSVSALSDSRSVNLLRASLPHKDKDKERDAASVMIPVNVPVSSGWSSRIADNKTMEPSRVTPTDTAQSAKKNDETTSRSKLPSMQAEPTETESRRSETPAVQVADNAARKRAVLHNSHSLEDLLGEERPKRASDTLQHAEMRSVISAHSFDARSSSAGSNVPVEDSQVNESTGLKQTAMLDAFIDDFDTLDETVTSDLPHSNDCASNSLSNSASSNYDCKVEQDKAPEQEELVARGSDSFLRAADPELGVPDLSKLSVVIPCIEQRPIAKRLSRKKQAFFQPSSVSIQVEQHELVAFFIVEVVYDPADLVSKPTRWRVARRYFEFYHLEEKLRAFHGTVLGSRLPPRDGVLEIIRRNRPVEQQLVDRMEYFDCLRPAFEKFLQDAVRLKQLRNSQLLFLFLTYKQPTAESAFQSDTRAAQAAQNASDAPCSAEFAGLFSKSSDAASTIGWEKLKTRMQNSFTSERKRQLAEPFLAAFARSVEPPPAKPSFGRYEATQDVSLERRILNNPVFRHARWNDRFELDVIPALQTLSLDEAWVADESLGDNHTADDALADDAAVSNCSSLGNSLSDDNRLDDFDSRSVTNSVSLSFVSAHSNLTDCRDRDEPLKNGAKNSNRGGKPISNSRQNSSEELDTEAIAKSPFDYFAACIVLVSRYFALPRFLVTLFNGLYRLDAFLGRTLFARSLMRSINNSAVLAQTDSVSQTLSDAFNTLASCCHVEVNEPGSLVNSLVNFLIRDKLERTLYDERRLLLIVELLQEAVFTPDASADKHISQEDVIRLVLGFYTPFLQLAAISERCFEDGVRRLVATLQDPQLNKLLTYQVLDCILLELFPELDNVDN